MVKQIIDCPEYNKNQVFPSNFNKNSTFDAGPVIVLNDHFIIFIFCYETHLAIEIIFKEREEWSNHARKNNHEILRKTLGLLESVFLDSVITLSISLTLHIPDPQEKERDSKSTTLW